MLTALVLICSIAETPDLADCTYRNAATLMRVPAEFASPTTCFMQAQAYLASTPTGRELTPDERSQDRLRAERNTFRFCTSPMMLTGRSGSEHHRDLDAQTR